MINQPAAHCYTDIFFCVTIETFEGKRRIRPKVMPHNDLCDTAHALASLPVIAACLPVIAACLPAIAACLPAIAACLPAIAACLPAIAAPPAT